MKVSAKAEYACVAMMELAADYAEGQPTRIKSIADTHGISQRFLVQILLLLKTKGLVASVRGASGGYQLARPPQAISLAEILGAIEGRTEIRSALEGARRPRRRAAGKAAGDADGGAPQRRGAPSQAARTILEVWREVQEEEQRLLRGISLADLLQRSRQGAELTYQI